MLILAVLCLTYLIPIIVASAPFEGSLALAFNSIRNLQIAFFVVVLLTMFFSKYMRSKLLAPELSLSRRSCFAFFICATASLIGAGWLKYFGFELHAIDFTIFDQMMHFALEGEWMVSPYINVNHLGVHPSWVMVPLVPFYAVFQTPLFLQTIGPLTFIMSGIVIWKLLAYFTKNDLLRIFLINAWFTNAWAGSAMNQGFHFETFYLIAFALFILGIKSNRTSWIICGVILGLLTKEDCFFYLLGPCVWLAWKKPEKRTLYASLAAASIAWGIFTIFVLQPFIRQTHGDPQPIYMQRFWGDLGSTPKEIAFAMLSHPLNTVMRTLTSHWYKLFTAMLFLPLLSPFALLAFLPIMILYANAYDGAHMRELALYYAIPFIPFLFIGSLEAVKMFPQRWQRLILLLFAVSFSVQETGYLKFWPIQRKLLLQIAQVRESTQFQHAFSQKIPLCADETLVPHLPHSRQYKNIADCLQENLAPALYISLQKFENKSAEIFVHLLEKK